MRCKKCNKKLTLYLEALREADEVICQLCIRLNPQHIDCTYCEDREERKNLIDKALEEYDEK